MGLFLNGLKEEVRVRIRSRDKLDLFSTINLAREIEREIKYTKGEKSLSKTTEGRGRGGGHVGLGSQIGFSTFSKTATTLNKTEQQLTGPSREGANGTLRNDHPFGYRPNQNNYTGQSTIDQPTSRQEIVVLDIFHTKNFLTLEQKGFVFGADSHTIIYITTQTKA